MASCSLAVKAELLVYTGKRHYIINTVLHFTADMACCLYVSGAAIIVIMVIAVVIGMFIFIGGLIYLKR